MYHYIVNPNSGDRSFDAIAPKLKSKLRSLGIDGPFEKTLDVNDTAKITHNALKRGAQTVVAIGGDKTVNEVITAVNESGRSSTSVGIIPLGHRNTLAHQVGIEDWQHGCELLAARRLRSFRLMDVNDYSFIQSCTIDAPSVDPLESIIEIDGEYRIKTPIIECSVSNTRVENPHLEDELLLSIASDHHHASFWEKIRGKTPTPQPQSRIHARVISIEIPVDTAAFVDGRKIVDRNFRFRLSQKPVHIISAKYNYDEI